MPHPLSQLKKYDFVHMRNDPFSVIKYKGLPGPCSENRNCWCEAALTPFKQDLHLLDTIRRC